MGLRAIAPGAPLPTEEEIKYSLQQKQREYLQQKLQQVQDERGRRGGGRWLLQTERQAQTAGDAVVRADDQVGWGGSDRR
jgi:hypothetical protein